MSIIENAVSKNISYSKSKANLKNDDASRSEKDIELYSECGVDDQDVLNSGNDETKRNIKTEVHQKKTSQLSTVIKFFNFFFKKKKITNRDAAFKDQGRGSTCYVPAIDSIKGKKQLSSDTLIIDDNLIKEKGMVSHGNDLANPEITNEYRLIKHKVLHNIKQLSLAESPNFNMLMVTSINPSEGKTFSAINLALSIASEKDNTILLVDANTHNPSICKTLDIKEHQGLIDYLLGDIDDIGKVIYNTTIKNFNILPVGIAHHSSNELLSSIKMQELAKELSHRYPDRVVIFDCPSLLGIVETVTMSRIVGQVIVVAEHSYTKLSDIEKGIAELSDELKIGFIVNKAIGGSYSRYGYGYEKKI
ncbi:AAA family ATPase [Photobacterium nomapromontoriensis]|uniref:AAA family ATPase n=1 Tax=Photobacterium nomapromontoriensis TaxID=2910237 RepID=UPI003D1363AD